MRCRRLYVLALALVGCRHPVDVSELTLDRSTVTVQPGGSTQVTLTRQHTDGALGVALVDAPPGVSADAVQLPSGIASVTLTLRATAAAAFTSAPQQAALLLSGGGGSTLPLFVDVTGPPGTLDTTFASGGSTVVPVPLGPCALDTTPSGGVVVAGGTDEEMALVELSAIGKPVPNFALRIPPPGLTARVAGLRVSDADVRVLAVTETARLGTATEMAFARLASDGTPATSFGMNGWAIISAPVVDRAALEVNGAGDTLAVLAGTDHVTCVSSFGDVCNDWGGFVSSAAMASLQAIALRSDGRILGAGWQETAVSMDTIVVGRWSTNGAPDASFGAGAGRVEVATGGTSELGQAIVALPDGGILVGGGSSGVSEDRASIVRLTADGVNDPSFGQAGVIDIPLAQRVVNETLPVRALFRQADGSILVLLEDSQGAQTLSRYTAAGPPDPSLQQRAIGHAGAVFCGARLQAGTGRYVTATQGSNGVLVERFWL